MTGRNIVPTRKNGQVVSMGDSHNGVPVGSDMDRLLGGFADKLRSRGLDCRLETYPVNGVKGRHFDKVFVSNPAASERGDVHIEKGGLIIWEFCVNLHDESDASALLDDVTNILRRRRIT
jgi:hypothetical protein